MLGLLPTLRGTPLRKVAGDWPFPFLLNLFMKRACTVSMLGEIKHYFLGSLMLSLFFYYFLRIETIRAAKTTLRVKCSYLMIALTILGCIVMVIKGKQVSTDFWLVSANQSSRKLHSSSRGLLVLFCFVVCFNFCSVIKYSDSPSSDSLWLFPKSGKGDITARLHTLPLKKSIFF